MIGIISEISDLPLALRTFHANLAPAVNFAGETPVHEPTQHSNAGMRLALMGLKGQIYITAIVSYQKRG